VKGELLHVLFVFSGVGGTIWIGFEGKNYLNGMINKYVIWFGPIDF